MTNGNYYVLKGKALIEKIAKPHPAGYSYIYLPKGWAGKKVSCVLEEEK